MSIPRSLCRNSQEASSSNERSTFSSREVPFPQKQEDSPALALSDRDIKANPIAGRVRNTKLPILKKYLETKLNLKGKISIHKACQIAFLHFLLYECFEIQEIQVFHKTCSLLENLNERVVQSFYTSLKIDTPFLLELGAILKYLNGNELLDLKDEKCQEINLSIPNRLFECYQNCIQNIPEQRKKEFPVQRLGVVSKKTDFPTFLKEIILIKNAISIANIKAESMVQEIEKLSISDNKQINPELYPLLVQISDLIASIAFMIEEGQSSTIRELSKEDDEQFISNFLKGISGDYRGITNEKVRVLFEYINLCYSALSGYPGKKEGMLDLLKENYNLFKQFSVVVQNIAQSKAIPKNMKVTIQFDHKTYSYCEAKTVNLNMPTNRKGYITIFKTNTNNMIRTVFNDFGSYLKGFDTALNVIHFISAQIKSFANQEASPEAFLRGTIMRSIETRKPRIPLEKLDQTTNTAIYNIKKEKVKLDKLINELNFYENLISIWQILLLSLYQHREQNSPLPLSEDEIKLLFSREEYEGVSHRKQKAATATSAGVEETESEDEEIAEGTFTVDLAVPKNTWLHYRNTDFGYHYHRLLVARALYDKSGDSSEKDYLRELMIESAHICLEQKSEDKSTHDLLELFPDYDPEVLKRYRLGSLWYRYLPKLLPKVDPDQILEDVEAFANILHDQVFVTEEQDVEDSFKIPEHQAAKIPLERLHHALILMKKFPQADFVSFHKRNVYAALQYALEAIGESCSTLRTHDLSLLFPNHPEVQKFNLKKLPDYPYRYKREDFRKAEEVSLKRQDAQSIYCSLEKAVKMGITFLRSVAP